MIKNGPERKKIIPIASGKGGVGTSIIAATLSSFLAMNGRKTILVDLDLGGANLYSYIGLKNNLPGLGNFFADRESYEFGQIIASTNNMNLSFVPGDVLVPNAYNTSISQRKQLAAIFRDLKTDYVILDLGSGCSATSLDFFFITDSPFIVTAPSIPSVLNTFNYLKNALFKFILLKCSDDHRARAIVERASRDRAPRSTPNIPTVLSNISTVSNNLAQEIADDITSMRPYLLLSRATSKDDISFCSMIRDLAGKMLSINLECIGIVFEDSVVPLSVRQQKQLIEMETESLAVNQIERIMRKLLLSPDYPSMPLDLESYKNSFALAEIEATNDDMVASSTEGQSNDVDEAKYLETISTQQKKIEELESTIRILNAAQQ